MHLRKLRLENFRSFRHAEYEFPRITLLTGRNSSGKSTVINGLLTILQGSPTESYPFSLTANGDLCSLGGFREIVHVKNMRSAVGLGLQLSGGPYKTQPSDIWDIYASFDLPKGQRTEKPKSITVSSESGSLNVLREHYGYSVNFEGRSDPKSEKVLREIFLTIRNLTLKPTRPAEATKKFTVKFTRRLKKRGVKDLSNFAAANIFGSQILYTQYLTALTGVLQSMRSHSGYLGPGRLYPDRFYFDRTPRQAKIGSRGENIPAILFRWQETEPEKLRQVNRYLRELKLAVNLRPRQIKSSVFQVMLNVSDKMPTVSLEDVGFGLSQVLPMIVLDIDLGKVGTLFMSQPELHLHPSAQASIAEYLLRRSKELQRQYVVETHSEYLLNRFRLLVAKGEIPPEEIALYYLSIEGHETKTTKVHIKKDGSLEGAPREFFDTYRLDTFNLAMTI